jgi:hypothetical protein
MIRLVHDTQIVAKGVSLQGVWHFRTASWLLQNCVSFDDQFDASFCDLSKCCFLPSLAEKQGCQVLCSLPQHCSSIANLPAACPSTAVPLRPSTLVLTFETNPYLTSQEGHIETKHWISLWEGEGVVYTTKRKYSRHSTCTDRMTAG